MGRAKLKKEKQRKEIIAASHTFGPTIEGNHWSLLLSEGVSCLAVELFWACAWSACGWHPVGWNTSCLLLLVCVHYIACIQWVDSQ
jgi:hypothetical protein